MKMRSLGQNGPLVSELGLGCMGMSDLYGPADRAESLATIHQALAAGVTLLDTGDFYGMGHNEMLLAEALQGRRRGGVVLSVKFGAQRGPGGDWLGYDARPQAVKTAAAYSLKRLGTDYIDIYRPARVDPAVPIEDTMGAIADLVKAGYVRHIGLSEAGADTIRRAHVVHPISDLQIEYSIVSRDIEDGILQTCRELGIGITAYGVLSRGLISGHWSKERGGVADFRSHSPRFQGENLERNLALVEALRVVAELARLDDGRRMGELECPMTWFSWPRSEPRHRSHGPALARRCRRRRPWRSAEAQWCGGACTVAPGAGRRSLMVLMKIKDQSAGCL
jgi:aryl-alcohol dehydrogenase-like predicted oxidoreductase